MADPPPVPAEQPGGGAVRISEQPGRTILQVSAFHGRPAALAEALGGALGTRPGKRAGEVVTGEGMSVLTLGPGRFWLTGERAPALTLDPTLAATVDQSHGRTVLRVEGDVVRDLLAKGCRVDLHPESFACGRCAQTVLGPFAVLLHCTASDTFEIHVARSYTASLRNWLEDAAQEFESAAGR